MENGNARLKLNKFHSDVPVNGLTPPELMVLHVVHQHNVGSDPINVKEITDKKEAVVLVSTEPEIPAVEFKPAILADPAKGILAQPAVAAKPLVPKKDVFRPRTNTEEWTRLRQKYGHLTTKKGDKILQMLFPGASPVLPQKFDDVKLAELTFDGSSVGAIDMGTSGGAAINQS